MCLDGPSRIAFRVYERLVWYGVSLERAEYIAQKVERRARAARRRHFEERRADTFDPYAHLPASVRDELEREVWSGPRPVVWIEDLQKSLVD
jgi:hypothetical protein